MASLPSVAKITTMMPNGSPAPILRWLDQGRQKKLWPDVDKIDSMFGDIGEPFGFIPYYDHIYS